MSDQLLAQTATYTTYNEHKKQTSIPSARFETAIPAIKLLLTYALDHVATEMDSNNSYSGITYVHTVVTSVTV
jgi:hypothetical protein